MRFAKPPFPFQCNERSNNTTKTTTTKVLCQAFSIFLIRRRSRHFGFSLDFLGDEMKITPSSADKTYVFRRYPKHARALTHTHNHAQNTQKRTDTRWLPETEANVEPDTHTHTHTKSTK